MESDHDKAMRIVNKRKRWVGAGGTLPLNVADAVVEGIILGRKEGMEMAISAIQARISDLPEPPNRNT